MQYLAIAVIVALAGLSAAAHKPAYYDDNMANQMVDQIVKSLTTKKELDPFKIEQTKVPIDKKIGLIHIKGSATIKNAVITGLSHISRRGDAKIDTDGGAFAATLKLGDKNIRIKTDLHLDLGKIIHPNLKFEGHIGDIDMKLKLKLDAEGKPSLDQFEIDEFEQVELFIHGLGPLDPLVDVIADSFVKYFNPQARKLVTDMLKPILVEEIKKLKLN
uniref:Mite allergen Lep d 7 n=1 Tax=Lepidoglyphus destructor TaxID=36936 RepID=ALL7_LEPDS|nr:RecName: Full=Mite allergen Lep d 7; AltName: Allergen=Lep d 7; Flags: Precursor [Lepidoglyphus destructor]CAB65963.1 putative allergen [Lepidoglyphus destructor]